MTSDAAGRSDRRRRVSKPSAKAEGRPLQTAHSHRTSFTVSRRDPMPMFTVTNAVDGARIYYGDIWQRKNVVLVTASESDPTAAAYTTSIIAAAPRLASA